MRKKILVFIEQRDNEIQNVSLELLGKGREIADKLDGELVGALIGNNVSDLCKTVGQYGADRVVTVEDKVLEVYTTEVYTKAMTAIIKEEQPEILLIGATTIGRDLAPRVSARVNTGLTADCTHLDIDEETKLLLMTRPAFGGNIMATIICQDFKPQMSTVRPGVMQKIEPDFTKEIEKTEIKVEFTADDMQVEVLEMVKEDKKQVNIEDAEILVSVGRGIGSKENLDKVNDLAKALKAEVSGSRAVIDNGWLDKDRQVGQTGKTVRPKLYLACGISGAIQHLSGMEDSEYIVAINKNPEAPIFNTADLGIVGDINKIIPELINELKKEQEGSMVQGMVTSV